jgi:SecD/SecF fusion protein
MQNKGAILIFTILFAVVCVYHLWFTKVTTDVRTDAKEFALGDSAMEQRYLDSVSGEPVYNFFGLRKYTYNECQQYELNLGLDLQGGMSVLLEVSVLDVLKTLAGNPEDSLFNAAIDSALSKQEEDPRSFVTIFAEAFEQLSPNGKLTQYFINNPDLQGKIQFESTNEEVMVVVKEYTDAAIKSSFDVLQKRVDQFGVAQPRITQLAGTGRIII